jgi:hypothetical protein
VHAEAVFLGRLGRWLPAVQRQVNRAAMVPIRRAIQRGHRNSQFSSAGRSSGIDWILRHTFVKSAKPSSCAAAYDTSIILPPTKGPRPDRWTTSCWRRCRVLISSFSCPIWKPCVNRRRRVTPPSLGGSTAWRADRRRDPAPINTLAKTPTLANCPDPDASWVSRRAASRSLRRRSGRAPRCWLLLHSRKERVCHVR